MVSLSFEDIISFSFLHRVCCNLLMHFTHSCSSELYSKLRPALNTLNFSPSFVRYPRLFLDIPSRSFQRRPNCSTDRDTLPEQEVHLFKGTPHAFRVVQVHYERHAYANAGVHNVVAVPDTTDRNRGDHRDNKVPAGWLDVSHLSLSWSNRRTIASGWQSRWKPS